MTPHQRDMQARTRDDRTGHELTRWRRGQLVRAGFSLPVAARVAGDAHYDLHALIELVEHGCPPELALRILAPLGGGDEA